LFTKGVSSRIFPHPAFARGLQEAHSVIARRFWPYWLLVFACLLAAPGAAGAEGVTHFASGGADTFSIELPAAGAKATVERSGDREISISLPANTAKRAASGSIDLVDPALATGAKIVGNKLVISLATNEIGYIVSPKGKLFIVQLYRDPLGARFAAPPEKPGKKAAAAGKTQPAAEPAVDAAGRDSAEQALLRNMSGAAAQAKPDAGPPANAQPPPVDVVLPPAPPKADQAARETTAEALPPGTAEPFFAVPNAMRAKAQKVGPSQAKVFRSERDQFAAPGPTQPPQAPGPPQAAVPGQAPQPPQPAQPAQPEAAAGPAQPAAPVSPDEIEYPGELRAKVSKGAPGEPAAAQVISAAPKPAEPAAKAEGAPQTGANPGDKAQAEQAATPETGAPGEGRSAKPEAQKSQAGAEPAAEPEKGHGQPAKTPEEEEEVQVRLAEAQNLEMAGELLAAAQIYDSYAHQQGLDPDDMSEALYKIANLLDRAYRNDLPAHFMTVSNAYQKALSSNPKSRWIPTILANLGELDLKAGNLPEAQGYFNLLKQRYPQSEDIPLINYYWGEYYFTKGDYRRASEEYQTLINQFPESDHVKEAASGLIKSFVKMNYFKEAAKIIDYVEKRWPRYYLDDPIFLLLSAETAYRLGDYPRAKKLYLQFYNILPKAENMDLVLARLGDVYLRQGEKVLAKQFYDRVIDNFPKSDGAQIAKMRLAEQGVFDDPSIQGMNDVFGRPKMGTAGDVYRDIISNFPDSSMAPLAQLKLALWQLFQGQNLDGLKSAKDYLAKYKDGVLRGRAQEIAAEAFNLAVAAAIAKKDYAGVIALWQANPELTGPDGKIADRTRLAAAYSYLKDGKGTESLDIAKPYITEKQNELGDIAFGLALRIYYENQAWPQILELAKSVQTYKLGPEQRRDLDYSLALAHENLGDTAQSRPLWAKLAADTGLSPDKRALAMYYNAKTAQAKPELDKALVYAQQALALFQSSGGETQRVKDTLSMLVDLYKAVGRPRDAVKSCEQYDKLTKEGDLDWAANQFKLASLFRGIGDMAAWQSTLEGVQKKAPGSNYAQMATSSLQAYRLEQDAGKLGTP
jgi:TolA-binding protein